MKIMECRSAHSCVGSCMSLGKVQPFLRAQKLRDLKRGGSVSRNAIFVHVMHTEYQSMI